jgi:hypothetical protein
MANKSGTASKAGGRRAKQRLFADAGTEGRNITTPFSKGTRIGDTKEEMRELSSDGNNTKRIGRSAKDYASPYRITFTGMRSTHARES